MAKTQKQIDEFFKSKKEQEHTLQPRSQMILNDEPLPSSKKKYQVTELDRVLQQAKQGFPELEEPNHYEMANEFLMRDIEVLKTKLKKGKDLNSKLQSELKQYRNLKSECHKDIEKVWMYDSSYGLDDTQTIDRDACIERVFYKIANEWID